MTPKNRGLFQYAGVTLTVICIMAGIVSAFSVTREQVRQQEQRIIEMKARIELTDKYNADDHKLILQKLATIEGILQESKSRTARR